MSRIPWTHRRDRWLQGAPWNPPAAFDWALIDYVVVHWPGCDCPPHLDPAHQVYVNNFALHLHKVHLWSRANKGWDYGYSGVIDYLGGVWEVRGDQFRAASNAPLLWNRRSISFQVATGLDGAYTLFQTEALARMITAVRAVRPNVQVVAHGDGRAIGFPTATQTFCPGPIRKLMAEAVSLGDPGPPTPTTGPTWPTPPIGDDEMIIVGRQSNGTIWYWSPHGDGRRHGFTSWEQFVAALGGYPMRDARTGRVVTHANHISTLTPGDLDKFVGKV